MTDGFRAKNEFDAVSEYVPNASDFVDVAAGFGSHGTVVRTRSDAGEAVEAALERETGPEMIDVRIRTDEPSVVEVADYDSAVDLL